MWPWEHLAVGFLGYVAVRRAADRFATARGGADSRRAGPHRGGPVVVLAVATQLPDLVDKPLAWSLGVLPSGTSLAHSLFVAVPASAVLLVASPRLERWAKRVSPAERRRTNPRDPRSRWSAYGAAVAVGWLSHLAGDALYPVLLGGSPAVGALLWPVVPAPPGAGGGGLVAQARRLFSLFVAFLATPRGRLYLLGEAALLGLSGLVWLLEGAPGVGELRRVLRWVVD